MVMFREDEQRMKKMERQEKLARQTPFGRVVRRIIKISLIVAAVVWVGLVLLSSLGGNHPALKAGIEDYLSQATGMEAQIGDFTRMGFFPKLEIDAHNIIMLDPRSRNSAVLIGSARFSAGFFDMMVSDRSFRTLALEHVLVDAGIVGDKALVIDYFGIEGQEGDSAQGDAPEVMADKEKPALVIRGTYGDKPLGGSMTLDRDFPHGGTIPRYRLADDGVLEFSLGDLKVDADVTQKKGGDVDVILTSLAAPEKLLSGKMTLRRGGGKIRITGDMSFGESTVKTDVKLGRHYAHGEITFPQLRLQDYALLEKIHDVLTALPFTGVAGPIDLYGSDVDLTIAVDQLKNGETLWGNVNLPVKIEEQVMTAGPLSGKIGGGNLDGTVVLDAKTLPATLKANATLEDWPSASGTLALDAGGEGKTYDEIGSSLNGKVSLRADGGQINAAALDPWGDKAAKLLGADTDAQLECLYGDIMIKDRKADIESFVITTAAYDLAASGGIDLDTRTADISIKNDGNKTGVRVKGPLQGPDIRKAAVSISPDKADCAAPVKNETDGR